MNYDGYYMGTAKAGQLAEAKTGNAQFVVTFDVTHRDSNGAWEPITPIERDVYLSTTEKAWPYTEKKLEALGFDGNFNAPKFANPQATIIARTETHDGKARLKWDIWTEREKPEYKPVTTDEQRKLMARWKQSHPQAASAPKPPATPAQPQPEDDGIPF